VIVQRLRKLGTLCASSAAASSTSPVAQSVRIWAYAVQFTEECGIRLHEEGTMFFFSPPKGETRVNGEVVTTEEQWQKALGSHSAACTKTFLGQPDKCFRHFGDVPKGTEVSTQFANIEVRLAAQEGKIFDLAPFAPAAFAAAVGFSVAAVGFGVAAVGSSAASLGWGRRV
jgi:hypothetical protein